MECIIAIRNYTCIDWRNGVDYISGGGKYVLLLCYGSSQYDRLQAYLAPSVLPGCAACVLQVLFTEALP